MWTSLPERVEFTNQQALYAPAIREWSEMMMITKDEISAKAKSIVLCAVEGRMYELLEENHDWLFGDGKLRDSQKRELNRQIELHLTELADFLK